MGMERWLSSELLGSVEERLVKDELAGEIGGEKVLYGGGVSCPSLSILMQ